MAGYVQNMNGYTYYQNPYNGRATIIRDLIDISIDIVLKIKWSYIGGLPLDNNVIRTYFHG